MTILNGFLFTYNGNKLILFLSIAVSFSDQKIVERFNESWSIVMGYDEEEYFL